jgi:hypothetical protein
VKNFEKKITGPQSVNSAIKGLKGAFGNVALSQSRVSEL